MEKEGKPSEMRLEEKRRRIRNLIDDFLNGSKKIMNEEEFTATKLDALEGFSNSNWEVIKKLRMYLRFLRTFVLFGDSSLDYFYERMSNKINKFRVMTQALFCQDNDEVILEKYNMDSLIPPLLEEMESYLSLKNSNYVAMITEEKMFEYLFTNLHDLPKYSSYLFVYLRRQTDYNIFLQVFCLLTDFYPILLANKTTTTQYLFPRFQFIAGVIVRGKKKEKDLWLKIQHNLDFFVSANNSLEIMQLSYDHLPCHLKPLLLYFARSRKSKRIRVSRLMQLWMAEGLVDHDIPSKCSLEEATQSHLDALISSNLIMVDHILSKKNMFSSVRIKVCYVHDVVHDFCSVKAKREKFLKLINPGARFHASDFLHHRLTIHTEDGLLHKKCVLFNSKKCSAGSKHLISLKVSGLPHNSSYNYHTRPFGLVRVLQLDSIVLEDSLMEEIGSLFHLRFLRIHTRDVKAIPVSWLNLQNLETLLINTKYSTMVLLPRILKLSKLKHVKIDRSYFFEKEEEEDNIQSRILEGENSKLTTLSHVYISYSEGTNDALKKFPNLQHLECTIRTPEDWFPKFDVLNKLESLIVKFSWKDNVYPNEYHFPSSLKDLRLYGFPLTPALLSAIALLPQLEILEIGCSIFMEYKWDASEDIYQSLKTLSLQTVNLSEWEVDRETFPKLEELILKMCAELTEIPCAFADIETLKSIRVMHMKSAVEDSAIEIKKQIIDFAGEDRLQVYLSDVLYELEAEEEDETENAQRTQG